MKRIACSLFLMLSAHLLMAQYKPQMDSALFDFWIGEWEASWINPDGTTSMGKNSIKKTLDDKVIQENFADTQGFKGTSISVYNSQRKTWHQAWADNQGGFYNLIGEVDGDKRVFRTAIKEIAGKSMTSRMVFFNITPTSMTWDWEKSEDGGKTWSLQWRIQYKKKGV